jgi:hypothetical protein
LSSLTLKMSLKTVATLLVFNFELKPIHWISFSWLCNWASRSTTRRWSVTHCLDLRPLCSSEVKVSLQPSSWCQRNCCKALQFGPKPTSENNYFSCIYLSKHYIVTWVW